MYKYYQPNKKDLKDKYGDCAVRAFCKATDLSWIEAYDYMWKISREIQCPLNCKYGFEEICKSKGFIYGKISNAKGTKRPTVSSFAKSHKKGTYICVVANHYVTIVDGNYYDTWDSGACCLYGYWYKEN